MKSDPVLDAIFSESDPVLDEIFKANTDSKPSEGMAAPVSGPANAPAGAWQHQGSIADRGDQRTVMGITSPLDRQRQDEDTSRAADFVTNDIPHVVQSAPALFKSGMKKAIGGIARFAAEDTTGGEGSVYGEDAVRPGFGTLGDPAALKNWGEEQAAAATSSEAETQAQYPVKTYAGQMTQNAVTSIGQQLPGVVAAAAGFPEVGLPLMGVQQFGQTYAESRARGIAPDEAATNALVQGATEVGTEMLPFMAIAKGMQGGISKAVLKEYFLGEQVGEHLATAIENASDIYFDEKDPQKRVDKAIDYWFSGKHGQDQIDTFWTTLIQSSLMAGGGKALQKGYYKVTNAVEPTAEQRAAYEEEQHAAAGDAAYEKFFGQPAASQPVAGESVPQASGPVVQPAVSPNAGALEKAISLANQDAWQGLPAEEPVVDQAAAVEAGQVASPVASPVAEQAVEQQPLTADVASQTVNQDVGQVAPVVADSVPAAPVAAESVPAAEPTVPLTPLDEAAHEAATSPLNDTPHPTAAQIEAGNYKKGHINLQGLDISIENPAGSVRSGVDPDGKAWETQINHHYGYIKGTIGKDKDHLDVFIGGQPESQRVFIVDQIDPKTGIFDEHKIMLGFDTLDEARQGYLSNYDQSGANRIGGIANLSVDNFKQWLKSGKTKKPYFGMKFARGTDGYQAKEFKGAAGEAGSAGKAVSPVVLPGMDGQPGRRMPVLREGDGRKNRVDSFKQKYGYQEAPASAPPVAAEKVIFSEDAYQQAKARMKERLGRVNMGLDPELMLDGLTIAGYHLERGAHSFLEYSRAMLAELGDGIRPYLKSFYNGARDLPGVPFSDKMDSYQAVAGYDVERLSVAAIDKHQAVFGPEPVEQVAEKHGIDAKALRAARFAETRRKNLKEKLAKAVSRNEKKRLEALLTKLEAEREKLEIKPLEPEKEVEPLKAEGKPEKDEAQEPFFKKGERVQLADGRHGIVVRVATGTTAMIDFGRGGLQTRLTGYNHMYEVKFDNGVEKYISFHEMNHETDPAPEAVKAPVYKNVAMEPEALLRSIQYAKERAMSARAAVSRAKKADKIAALKKESEIHDQDAAQMQAVYDQWAEETGAAKPVEAAQVAEGEQQPGLKMSLKETKHAKKGHQLFVVTMDERVERDEYEKLNRDAKRTGNGYSSFRGNGAIPGFQFLEKAAADAFMQKWAVSSENKVTTPDLNADNKAETTVPVADARLGDRYKNAGKQAFLDGKERQAPAEVINAGYAANWLRGWDAANIAAPVETTDEAKVNEFTQSIDDGIVKSGGTDNEIRGDVPTDTGGEKPARAGTAESRGETSGDAGGRRSAVRTAGNGTGVSDVSGDREAKPVRTGADRSNEHGGNDGQGDSSKRSVRVHPEPGQVTAGNYRISDADNLGKGGAKQKARDNVTAIKLLKQITQEERPATAEEQAQLVKYVGWGASELANGIFEQPPGYANGRWAPASFKEGWEELGKELQAILTPEEYSAAKKSTMNAHYTPAGIIEGMYKALEVLGFNGGRVLEPGSGIGHFIGLLPDRLLANTRFTGVELDNTTAAIAKLLYPGHDIRHQGFEKFMVPNGFYDVAVGNIPFADIDITADPDYARHKFKLHDYFFAKSIDKVRPGGLLLFVTSKGTMDKANDKARAYLMERADLVGAIRLPETAFKENAGTEVVTDVLILQKRPADVEAGGKAWGVLKEVDTPDGKTWINEYFADNPQMVLGENRIQSSQFGPKYTVLPNNGTSLAEQFDFTIRNYLPENIYTRDKVESPADRSNVEFDLAPGTVKEGAYYLDKAGQLFSKENGAGVPSSKSGKDLEKIKAFIPLRDALRQVLYVQVKEGDLAAAQKVLKKQYDAFVKKFGFINLEQKITTTRNGAESVSTRYPNFTPFRDDPDSYLVASIERYDSETNTAKPGVIFTERTIKPEVIPQINSITDALHVVMHEQGMVDIDRIAEHMNVTPAQAIAALGDAVYHDPQTMQWQTDDEYLSGNVKQKLAMAETSALADPSYLRNVEALKAVQPEDLPPSRISIGLGEPIVKPEYVEQFAEEVINMGIRVSHLKLSGGWAVERLSGYSTPAATSEWGTGRRNAAELIDAALNSRQVRIESSTIVDGKEVKYFDKDATNAAIEKLAKIKERFSQWVWENPARAEDLSRVFNDAYNNSVKRVYGGDHISKMQFPGMSSIISPHEHQKRVAWRVVQSGNTYMAHSVGAGKTIGSILAGMELKRLGIKKKPMWVVPNHMLKQFAGEFLQLYPAAKIMVADEAQFSKENRNRFMGRVAAENWDGVIITHSAFGKMQVSPDFSSQFIQEQIGELEWALAETDKGDRLKRKQIEQAKARLEQRLEKVLNAADKDKGVTFEETGIDQLFVDEAHEFRKLDFATNQTNIKGIDPNGSLMAFDLYVKSRYLEKLYPGRSLVLMSGTAITNTIGEIFTIQRFLQEPKLKELGLDNFDAWSAAFGDMVTKLEATPAGNYKPVTRFAKFKKLASLSQIWSEVGDFIHAKDLTYIKRPVVKTGGRILVTGEQSSQQKAYKLALAARLKAIEQRKGPPQKGDDIILSVITDGRHAALDERYISNGKPSKDNKLEKMVSNVKDIWQETAKQKLTQMIFCDLGMPGSEERRGFSAYKQIKESLIAQGIPEKEIAFIQDYKKSDEKIKLFRAMNEGKVRVLIGSSEAMGTGVNAQRKLVALHHLDPDTYLPSNIEQREGRIIRQGNENEEVRLFAYVTKGSYDETMWQFLETKQRFIDQFLSGDAAVDEATDIDGGADSFAMARAMSSDNPLVLERAGIESDIQRLESLKRAHFDDQQILRRNVMRAEQNLPEYHKTVKALESVIAKRVDTSGDRFAMQIGKETFDKRKDAGESLGKVLNQLLSEGAETDWHDIGELGGLKVKAHSGEVMRMPWVTLSVGIDKTFSSPLSFQGVDALKDLDPVGLAMKLENLGRKFDNELEIVRGNIARDEKLLKESKERVGRPFEHAKTLEEKHARLEEIEQILKADEQQGGAADSSGVELHSNPMLDPALIVRELTGLAGNIKAALPQLVELGKVVLHKGATNYQLFVKSMKEQLGALWDSFKGSMLEVYQQARAAYKASRLGDERGAVGADLSRLDKRIALMRELERIKKDLFQEVTGERIISISQSEAAGPDGSLQGGHDNSRRDQAREIFTAPAYGNEALRLGIEAKGLFSDIRAGEITKPEAVKAFAATLIEISKEAPEAYHAILDTATALRSLGHEIPTKIDLDFSAHLLEAIDEEMGHLGGDVAINTSYSVKVAGQNVPMNREALNRLLSAVNMALPTGRVAVKVTDTIEHVDKNAFQAHGVESGVVAGMTQQVASASQVRAIITLAMKHATTETGYHEIFHAAKALGLITAKDQAILDKAIGAKAGVAADERQADNFARYALKQLTPLPVVRQVWDEILGYVKRVGNYLAGHGYRTATDVFEDLWTGKLKGQAASNAWLEQGDKLMVAFHGSPHDFDRFSTEHIGNGEGAQAYGYGLYFAGSKDVAEFYKNKLSGGGESVLMVGDTPLSSITDEAGRYAAGYLAVTKGNTVEAVTRIKDEIRDNPYIHKPMAEQAIKWLQENEDNIYLKSPGKLYHVELAPSENEYLLWDKPLSEQSEKVKAALNEAFDDIVNREPDYHKASELSRYYQEMKKKEDKASGAYIYKNFAMDMGDQAASEYLHYLGIRGIKYLDGTSRGKGEGNYNYVIFNDSDVNIVAKYSLQAPEEQADAVAELVNFVPDKLADAVAPIGYRVRKSLEYVTPADFKEAVAWFFRNPFFQAEADPLKQPFYSAGSQREVDRMSVMLAMFGWEPGNVKERPTMQKVKDFLFSWQSGDKVLRWEQLKGDIGKLEPGQRRALDTLIVQGDVYGVDYSTLNRAKMNPRVKKADPSEATFGLYKRLREYIDGHVEKVIVDAVEHFLRTAGMSEGDVAQHISDYRKHKASRIGWLTRDHGDGDIAVRTYRTVKELRFETRSYNDDFGTVAGEQALLSLYPGKEVETRLRALAKGHGVTVIDTAPGGMIFTKKGSGEQVDELGYAGALRQFLEEAGQIVPELVRATGSYPKVLVYAHYVGTQWAADRLKKQVEADYAKAMPHNFREEEEYHTLTAITDKLSESMYADMKSDMAVEAVLLKATTDAFKRGELSKEDVEAYRQTLTRNTAEVLLGRAAGKYQIRRAPYLIEGYQADGVTELYQDYMTSVSGQITKAGYAREQFELFQQAKPVVRTWAERYIKDSLRNMGRMDRISGNIRALAALWYMGFKVSTVMINLTQPLTIGFAELGRYTRWPLAKILRAQRDIIAGKLTAEEKRQFETAIYQVQEMETAIGELSGHGDSYYEGASKGLNLVTGKALALFQKGEVFNRQTMILAAYRVFRHKGLSEDEALHKAVTVNAAVNFDMGRHNLPGWARNPVGRTAYALQSFGWNSFNYIYNRATSGEKEQMIALMRYMGMLLVLGGMGGWPLLDEFDKAFRKLRGYSFLFELKGWLKKEGKRFGSLGDALNGFIWHGLPALAGVNVSNSMRLQIPIASNLLNDNAFLESAMGVSAGLFSKLATGVTYAGRGQTYRAVEALAPEVAAGGMRAYRQMTDGVTTGHGKKVFHEGKPMKMTEGEATLRVLGFQPMRTSEASAEMDTGRKLHTFWKQERDDAIDEYRATKRLKVVHDFNARLRQSQAVGLVEPINSETIRRALTSRPDKKKAHWESIH